MSDLLSDERRASVVTQLRALVYQHANNQREPNISGLCAVAANELEALGKENETLRRGYVPQDIAQECLAALAPLDVKGEPNTLWALVLKAMRTIADLEARLAAVVDRHT